MKRLTYSFKGFMAPVVTAFNNDAARSVNYEIIDAYAKHIRNGNVPGVLVNGTGGEGTLLNLTERMRSAEEWRKAGTKYGLNIMVQIGGTSVVDAIELAKHAEKIGADSVLCLPEMYLKPRTEQALVDYLKQIAKHCPNTPFLYYHIPMFSGVDLSMPKFLDMAEEVMPNFVGLKYTSADLDQGSQCLKEGRTILLGWDPVVLGGVAHGFDSFIIITLNYWPEIAIKIKDLVEKGHIAEARKWQNELNKKRLSVQNADGNTPGATSKALFKQLSGFNLDFGPSRYPNQM